MKTKINCKYCNEEITPIFEGDEFCDSMCLFKYDQANVLCNQFA